MKVKCKTMIGLAASEDYRYNHVWATRGKAVATDSRIAAIANAETSSQDEVLPIPRKVAPLKTTDKTAEISRENGHVVKTRTKRNGTAETVRESGEVIRHCAPLGTVFPVDVVGKVAISIDVALLVDLAKAVTNFGDDLDLTLFIDPENPVGAIPVVGSGGAGLLMPMATLHSADDYADRVKDLPGVMEAIRQYEI